KAAEELGFRRVLVNKGGQPKAVVWDNFITGEPDGKGHYDAKCKYCVKENWQCGRSAGVIKDNYTYLQDLAQILFAIVPSQASCECNFSVLQCLYNTYCSRLSPEKIESMTQIHSFYISNLKNELKYYGKELSKGKLRDSALALTTYATTENHVVLEHEYASKSVQSINEKLQISFIVDLSHTNFDGQGNFEDISFTTQGSGNMEFDPVTIVESEFQFANEDL
ncbi:4476_t:CDS:2, partial [Cetraspora pellucida]